MKVLASFFIIIVQNFWLKHEYVSRRIAEHLLVLIANKCLFGKQ